MEYMDFCDKICRSASLRFPQPIPFPGRQPTNTWLGFMGNKFEREPYSGALKRQTENAKLVKRK